MKKVLTLLLVLGVIAAGATLGSASPDHQERASTTSWLQYRGNQQRTGYNPTETQITPETIAERRLFVQGAIPFAYERFGPTPPLIYNDTLYSLALGLDNPDAVEDDVSTLYAMNPETGRILWTHDFSCVLPGGVPAISVKAQVIVVPLIRGCGGSGRPSKLIAVDLATHEELWDAGGGASTPTIVGGTVFASIIGDGGSAFLVSIDAATGARRWTVDDYFGIPTVGSGVLYLFGGGDVFFAFDASTGDLLWERNGTGYPAISGGRVYVPCDAGICSYSRTGNIKWTFEGYGEISIAQGRVIVGCGTEDLCAVNPRTGATLWQTPSSDSFLGEVTTTTVAGGVVYVQRDGTRDSGVDAVDLKTGQFLWMFGEELAQSSPYPNKIVVANGRIYLTHRNLIYVFGLGPA